MTLAIDTRKRKKRRRIMHEFRLTEISAVDSPAQKGARVAILKRDDNDNGERFGLATAWADEQDRLDAAKGDDERHEFNFSLDEQLADLKARSSNGVDALRRLRFESPELFDAPVQAPVTKRGPSRATQEFQTFAQGIAEREGCSQTEAMRRARR